MTSKQKKLPPLKLPTKKSPLDKSPPETEKSPLKKIPAGTHKSVLKNSAFMVEGTIILEQMELFNTKRCSCGLWPGIAPIWNLLHFSMILDFDLFTTFISKAFGR